jgi:hypothetical protein
MIASLTLTLHFLRSNRVQHKEPNTQWGADCVEYAMLKLSTKFVEDRLAAAEIGMNETKES